MSTHDERSGAGPSRPRRKTIEAAPVFCTSLSALYPELPRNKWMRALRRPWAVAAERMTALAS